MENDGRNTSVSSFQVCIILELLSIGNRASLITSAILRDIRASLNGDNISTKLPSSYFELRTMELNISDCDHILIVCFSVSSDLDLYDKFKNKYVNVPLETENNLGQPIFHFFIKYESKLWLDGCNYYHFQCPKIILGFLQFTEISQFDACKQFEDSLINNISDNLIEQSTLITIWIVSTPEIFNNSNVRLVNNLFNKNYVLLSSAMLTNFVHWVEGLKRNFEENDNEVLESVYANYINKLEKNANGLPLDTTFLTSQPVISDTIDSPAANRTYTYKALNLQTFGEFYIDKDEWNSISYLDKDGRNRMNRNWTSLIVTKFSEINYICVLKFKHYWFKKSDSRKLRSPFFQAWEVCTFSNCISVSFSIENDFELFEDNKITVHYHSDGNFSLEHEDNKTTHARHITSNERENMGQLLMHNSVSNVFYRQFKNEKNIEAFKRGNFTNLKSQHTLRRIKSDTKSLDRFSNDDLVDISETQQYFRSLLPDDALPGYIQYLVQDPFIIHLYTKKQIELFKLFNHDKIVLNIDATGSLIA